MLCKESKSCFLMEAARINRSLATPRESRPQYGLSHQGRSRHRRCEAGCGFGLVRPARSLTRVARLVQVPVGGQGLLLWLWLRCRCVCSFLEELL